MFAYCLNNPVMYSDPSGYFMGIVDFIHNLIECTIDAIENIYVTSTATINKTITEKIPNIDIRDFGSETVSFLYIVLIALESVDSESYDKNTVKFAWDVSVEVVFEGASGYLGGATGAKIGALVGEGVGSAISPGVGSVVGPIVGFVAGVIVGAVLSFAFEDTKEFVKGWVDYER